MRETTTVHAGASYRALACCAAQDAADMTAQAAGDVFALFAARAAAFGYGEDIVADEPPLGADSHFLRDPAGWLAARRAALAREGRHVRQTVILTTFGPLLAAALGRHGFAAEPVGLPAAPDGSLVLRRREGEAGLVHYVEAVNEADPKVAPNFAVGLFAGRTLAAGMCGTIAESGGERAAWIAANATRADAPAGLGAHLARLTEEWLASQGVARIDLGTQTAPRFYQRLGYETRLRVVEGLRTRRDADGRVLRSDLVMMTKRLAP